MAPAAKESDLLYVSNVNGLVSVYNYSKRTLVGVLTNFAKPLGACSNTASDVFIVDYQNENVSEYAHGAAKPIKTLSDSPYTPAGCSVAPPSGNLAVANAPYGSYSEGNIAIYSHDSGPPTILSGDEYNDHFTDCAYDDSGNLLATSTYGNYNNYTHFYYLPKDGTKLVEMDLSAPGQTSGWEFVQGVLWDGKYWGVLSYDRLYRFTINVTGSYVDTVTLSGGAVAGPPAIYRKDYKGSGTQLVGANGGGGSSGETAAVNYWNYPAGGSPVDDITKYLDQPFGVAISLGPQ